MKQGLDYFGLDVAPDTALELIEAEFGLVGFAVTVKLLAYIFGGQGYYCDWNGEVALLMARRLSLEPAALDRILSALLRRHYFDPRLMERYGVLTSAAVQKRYFTAAARRKELEVRPELLLTDPGRLCKTVGIPPDLDRICAENADISPQRKGKKSKAKKSTAEGEPPAPAERESHPESGPQPASSKKPKAEKRESRGKYGHVRLSASELSALRQEYGAAKVEEYITRVDRYCQQHGRQYKDFALTLRLWMDRDAAPAPSAASLSEEDDFVRISLQRTPKL